jgi:phosphate transport system substrate-binding protein
MARSQNDTVPLVLALLITAGLLAAGVWFLRGKLIPDLGQFSSQASGNQSSSESTSQTASSESAFQLDTALPDPEELTIDGSVTMVALMKQLQLAYTQVNPALPTTYGVPDGRPNGTNAGIQNLVNGSVWMAASSRPLTAEERTAGLQSIPIARDALAIVVGADNPFTGSLTLDQLKQIFQGQITNWSQVGGADLPIRVINRSPNGGSSTFFRDVVLLGESFAPDGQNFTTLTQDETTPLLRALGNDGISYSTVQQVENQKTVRIIPIEGISPTDREAVKANEYPISRVVYLVVKQQTSPAVKQFIEMARSPQGQQIVQRVGFIPL